MDEQEKRGFEQFLLRLASEQGLAVAGGAADEALFGLPSKYIPGYQEKLESNPKSATLGRVGSYFIPLPTPNKLRLITKGPTALKKFINFINGVGHVGLSGQAVIGRGAEKLAEIATKKMGKGIVPNAARGAISGSTAAVGNKAVRDLLGTGDDQTYTQAATGGAAFGAGAGAIGGLLQKLAPAMYQHPALINRNKLKESRAQAEELMNEGTWGTLGGRFAERADELQGTLRNMREILVPRMADKEYNTMAAATQLVESLPGARMKLQQPKGITEVKNLNKNLGAKQRYHMQTGSSRAEQGALEDAFQDAQKSLRPDKYGTTDVLELEDASKAVNTKIKKLSDKEKAKAFGDPGQGDVSQELDRALALREAYNDLFGDALKALGSKRDTQWWNNAKKIYRRGADLEANMRSFDRSQQGQNRFGPDILTGIVKAAGNATVNSPIFRTGSGVAMSKASPASLGAKAGRLKELRGRQIIEMPELEVNPYMQEEQSSESDEDFLKRMDEKNKKALGATDEKNPRKVQRYKTVEEEENPYLKGL